MKRVVLGMAALVAMAFAPQAAGAQSAADLTLVHGIPGVTVDLAVGGTIVVDNFEPGSLANISSFAGQTLTDIVITDDATGDVLITADELVIPGSGSYSIVAHYNEASVPVITQFENSTTALAEGQARLTVRHTAAATPIDVISGDTRPVENLANGHPSGVDAVLVQAVGNFSGEVALTGGDPIPGVDPISIDLAANTNTILYAVGSVDESPDFLVQVVDTETTDESTTTTTDPNATTTTTDPNATTTTTTSTTTTTVATPVAVNTGSPLDGDSNTLLIVVALGGLALAGGAMLARRRT